MMKTNSLQLLLGTGALVTVAFSATSPAHAFTLTRDTVNAFSQVSGITQVLFEGTPTSFPYTENGVQYSGKGLITNLPDVSNRYAAPPAKDIYNQGTNYLTLGASQETGPVSIKLPSLSDYFGLYWGSVDTFNSIKFYRGGNLIAGGIFSGSNILPLPSGDQSALGAVYANFFASNSSQFFDEIRLSSSEAAFESDNHAFRAVIPTPALLPGLIGMGIAALRRKNDETAEESA